MTSCRNTLFAVLATVLLALATHSQAATNTWNGPGDGSNDWSSAANWLPGVPDLNDYVKFTDAGASLFVSNVNNVADDGFSKTIGTLHYANANGYHTTLIPTFRTLGVMGNLIVDRSYATITGTDGTLLISNPTANIVVCSPNVLGGSATLDISGLNTFNTSIGRILLGTNNATGTLILAKNNTITASGATPAIIVAIGGTNVQGGTSAGGILILGQTNNINADSICVGYGFAIIACSLRFNSQFSNSVARFRGQDGISRMDTFTIGDGPNFGSFGLVSETDFTLGIVDLQINKLQVGRVQTNTMALSNLSSRGRLRFSKGTIDVNTMQIGLNSWTNNSYAIGTVNVQGTAKLIVNTALDLGYAVGNLQYGSNQTMGELNIEGGTVMAASINANYRSTNNTITMTNGTLIVSNSMGPGIRTFAMVNSTLQVPAAIAPSVIVTNLITGGVSNLINVGSFSGLSSFPTQMALIKYSGTIGGAGYNFSLGSLPSQNYTGYLSNNLTGHTIDVVLNTVSQPSLSARMVSDSEIELSITSGTNSVIDIQASTNLTDWTLLTTWTNVIGTIIVTEPITNYSKRFFRAKQKP